MNPPFHDATRQNLSPDPRRRLAHAAAPGLLPRWVASAAQLLKPQGVLTLIWRADALAEVQRDWRLSSAVSPCCRFIRAPTRRRFACWCAR